MRAAVKRAAARLPPRLTGWLPGLFLAALYLAALGADFVAPYAPADQDRSLPFAPPTRVRFVDAEGRWHPRPFVYRWQEAPDAPYGYAEDRSRRFPLRFFAAGEARGPLGVTRRLVTVGAAADEAPARLALLGTDRFGRDLLSRWLYGARVSLFAGLLAGALAVGAGLVIGALAGYFGGVLDGLAMRGAELFMVLPWLYLLLAVRAFLPLELGPVPTFFLLVTVIGAVGWARPARLVRGVARAARERDFVRAARGFGASHLYLLRRHVLPQTYGVALAQLMALVPRYVLAEVTLSFLGLGIAEPAPSWGNLLAALRQTSVALSHGWLLFTAGALAAAVLSYHRVASALCRRLGVVTL